MKIPSKLAAAFTLSLLGAALSLAPQAGAAQQAPAALDQATRVAVVDSVALLLERMYVDEAVGRDVAREVRRRVRDGAYAEAAPAAFAQRVMADMQALSRDKHLQLYYDPKPGPMLGTMVRGARRPPLSAADSLRMARSNYFLDRVERLEGNVGYLKISQFVTTDFSREAAAAAMAFLANSDAVILDLRGNNGGAPDLVDFILSYFHGPEPVKLSETYSRAFNAREERWTLAELPGRRIPQADLYVLTDRNTFSAGEYLAYAVQQLRRGTVVGETTGGGGNGVAPYPVGAGFRLYVSLFRQEMGPGWERTGVKPDVEAAGEDALAMAHRMALEKLVAAAGDPQLRREREWALEWARAVSRPVRPGAEDLARYAGTYGTRTVSVEGSTLFAGVGSGRRVALTPAGGDVFLAPRGGRYRFERDAEGRVSALVVESTGGAPLRELRAES